MQRKDRRNPLAPADLDQRRDVIRRIDPRNEAEPIGELRRRCQRVDIGNDNPAVKAKRLVGATEGAHQLHAPAGTGKRMLNGAATSLTCLSCR